MKLNNMTIADVQKKLSKYLNKQNLSSWSIDDEIMTARFDSTPVIQSRNKREGGYNGCYNKKHLRDHHCAVTSWSGWDKNRKQRKLGQLHKMKLAKLEKAFLDMCQE